MWMRIAMKDLLEEGPGFWKMNKFGISWMNSINILWLKMSIKFGSSRDKLGRIVRLSMYNRAKQYSRQSKKFQIYSLSHRN